MKSADVRVLLVSPTFGAYGGMEAFVLTVAEALRQDGRFAVRICFKRARGFELRPELAAACAGLPVEFCGRASRALVSAIAWADVVHGQNASPDVAALATLLSKPLAVSVHNVLPAAPRTRRLAWRLAAAGARTRWYNSRFVWNSWEARQRTGSAYVPPLSVLPETDVAPIERRGFVFLGRLVAGKGVDVLLDAYERAALDPERWPLTIFGEGPMRPLLDRNGAQGSRRGVRFGGFVTGADKTRALAGARWLVVPSHWGEPFGLVAHEARSVGVPCIVSRDGGLPEAAGNDALVCPPADAAALAAALRQAAEMTEAEYVARARRTRAELQAEITPASFYAAEYLRLQSGAA
jgi:glycosyltransferase involved in cell wall biosynthesis